MRLEDPLSRFVHGSDFPIPSSPFAFRGRTDAGALRRVAAVENPLQRDIELKRLAGVPDACLTRAHDALGLGRPRS